VVNGQSRLRGANTGLQSLRCSIVRLASAGAQLGRIGLVAQSSRQTPVRQPGIGPPPLFA